MKYALLVIDVNVGIFDPNSRGGILHRAKERLISCINDLASAFRARDLPVVWVTQRNKDNLSDAQLLLRKRNDGAFAESSMGWHLLPELQKQPSDHLIIKPNYSAFFGTDLHPCLRRARITSLVVAGVNIHTCVRVTTIDAYQRGYDPLIWPRDGVSSSLPEFEKDPLDYMAAKPDQLGLVEGLLSNQDIKARL